VRKAYYGEVMLPDFQRNFVWARNDKRGIDMFFIGKNVYRHISYTTSEPSECSLLR
jgi:uncharacterized protein with ParB-like and HNH nuclease domain